jgi:NADH-quinone oxidoreductase subunit L
MHVTALVALFAPLGGFVAVFPFLARTKPAAARFITCGLMTLSTGCSLWVLYKTCGLGETGVFYLFPFLEVGALKVSWGIRLDELSGLMMGVVTLISLIVHLYAFEYLSGDESVSRFLSFLSLFTFFMLLLVTAPHLVQLFVGWEGVSLASYLVIAHTLGRQAAVNAATKAFVVTRIGDVGLLLGMGLTFAVFQTTTFDILFAELPQKMDHHVLLPLLGPVPSLPLICGLFFLSAASKSAQFSFHVWLPDAMEGPTPASALMHAATMVTAGVFLMVRLAPFLETSAGVKDAILATGALTAFFGSAAACAQTNIKKVMAYSTCGQLGLMFMAVGVSAYGPAMFHLTTHAFFKALLFLSVGSLTHALSGEQNLKAMGGMAGLTPVTCGIMGIGCLSLMGLPFFSGYYSKEAILACLWIHHSPLAQLGLGVGFGVVGLTAFYCARLLILVFRGSFRGNPIVLGHAQESSFTLLAPLLPLIIGAVFVGGAQAFFLDNPCLWNSGLGHAGVTSTIPLLPSRLPSRLHHLPLVVSALALSVAFFLLPVKTAPLSFSLGPPFLKFFSTAGG